jgi:NDP-hexose-3-ketoreductase
MPNQNKIRVGILGCAAIAIRSIIPELKRHEAFHLVAISSRTKDKADAIAAGVGCDATSYDSLIANPDLDAIYVPLPTGLHAEWVMRALESGKHVLCEKSLGCSLAEVEAMTTQAREKRLLLMENFQFRFHSQHATVKQLVASGMIGQIRCFRTSFGFPPFADGAANIRYQKDLGGGALLDAGAYTIKATTFMLGDTFKVKAATLNHSADYDVEIGGAIYMENNAGLVSETAFGFDNFYQCNYEIWGSKGKLTAKRAFTAPPDFVPEIVVETAAGIEVLSLAPDNHFSNMLAHFAEKIFQRAYEDEYGENLIQARLMQQVRQMANQ